MGVDVKMSYDSKSIEFIVLKLKFVSCRVLSNKETIG